MKKQFLSGLRKFSSARAVWNDRVTVDPRKMDAVDTGNFFKYETGRWLKNDREQREARTTKFSVQGLLEVLKDKANLTDKAPEIDTIEPWFEGKHNKLYKVTLQDNRSYVLRLPYAIVSPEYRRMRLLSEVATMDFVKTTTDIKVPSVLSYSGTEDNEIGMPYILMDFVAGNKLAEQWNPATPDVESKLPVIEPVAHIASQLLNHKFETIGSLFFASDVDGDFEKVDKYVVGPSMEKRFWRSEAAAPFRGPFKTVEEYLQATAGAQLAYAAEPYPGEPCEDAVAAELAAQRYADLVPALFTSADVAKTGGNRLNLPDLGPLNVLHQDNEAFWLIDFENASVKPYVLHGLPWFVRCPHERIYATSDVPNYDKLNEQQQRVVQQIMSLTQCEFTYEKLVLANHKDLVQAHHPSYKRREEVVRAIMSTDINRLGFYNDIDFAVYKLLHLWPALGVETTCPIELGPEVSKIEESVGKWNQTLMRDPTIENKSFLGSREFDNLLGRGLIEPVGEKPGNYQLTPKFFEATQL